MFFLSDDPLFSEEELLLMCAASGGKTVEDTATGNPLTFTTDIAKPLKSLLVPFLPVQSGSGDPSPQNIRPIVAWDGVKVFGGGKNLFNKETATTGVWWRGAILTVGYENYKASNKIPVHPNTQYYLSRQSAQQGAVCYFDKNKNYVDQQTWDRYNPSRIIPDGVYYIAFTVEAEYIDSAQFEAGQTDTAYEPYQPITETDISFPSPVYGGEHEAVSGVLQARQYDSVTFKWGDATNRTVIGNVERRGFIVPRQVKSQDDLNADPTARFCSVAPWKYSYSSDDVHYYGGGYSFYVFLPVGTDENLEFQLVVERPLQPQEITLTPEQITAIKGNNTIWSDANGSMTAVYLKKG